MLIRFLIKKLDIFIIGDLNNILIYIKDFDSDYINIV